MSSTSGARTARHWQPPSRSSARPRSRSRETRLILSTSVASAYAGLLHLYTLRDNAADTLALRMQTVALFRQRHQFGLETLASVRQVEARQAAAKGDLLAIDERIGLQKERHRGAPGRRP